MLRPVAAESGSSSRMSPSAKGFVNSSCALNSSHCSFFSPGLGLVRI
jgi:hypothetical protein